MRSSLKTFVASLALTGLSLPALAAENIDLSGNQASAASQGYELVAVPSDGIEQFMPIGDGRNGIPVSIQGIWWMDGNPLGDILLTLAGATYDPTTRKALLQVYGAGAYSFLPTEAGRNAYQSALDAKLTYEINFSEDYTSAFIVPIQTVLFQDGVRVPDGITNFTMRLLEDGHFLRESAAFGFPIPSYNLRRIVRADGTRDAAYAEYLNVAPAESLIAVKK